MIFSILILLLLLAVAFFHYVQGLFSATLSALIAVIASMMAISYHETLANILSGGKFSDYALAITMISIFAGVYIVLRLIFDKLVPGNVRVPLLVDKIGAGVMGVVAAAFATGTLAVAAQTLPFSSSLGGYSRYEIAGDRPVQVKVTGKSQMQDLEVFDELRPDTIDGPSSGMLVPVDDMVIGVASMLSNGGSLAGARSLTSVHPDYLQELFGQRTGIHPGAKRTAMPVDVTVDGVYWRDQLNQIDAEIDAIRKRALPASIKARPDSVFLVVRTMFKQSASDRDNIVRFSPSVVRLLANGKNYFPIGTLEGGTLYANRADDALFVNVAGSDGGADLVFQVDAGVAPASPTGPSDRAIAPGTFLEFKRFARIDLSGKTVPPTIPASANVKVLRKSGVGPAPKP